MWKRFPLILVIASYLLCGSSTFEIPRLPRTFSTATGSQQSLAMTSNDNDTGEDGTPFRLGYVTDVEGNTDYFLHYVEQSSVLSVQHYSNQSLRLDLKHPDDYFVFGGDSVDKGTGDIRLVRALVDLKQRYPNQVFLLVGNRDLNKLRFAAELSDDDMARPIEDIPPPHWDPKAPSLLEYLNKKQEEDARKTIKELNTRLNRLHYMLEHTLGCPNTFEFRRKEFSLLQDKETIEIRDEEVLRSFLFEVEDPNGSLRQYLEIANVAVVIGNTLFCHGAVDANTMKYIPRDDTKFENPISKPPAKTMIEDVHQWVEELNHYLKKGLEDYRQRPHFNADRTSRGGESLMALQNRPAMWGRSIVSNCYGDGGCITTEYATQVRTDPERISMEATNPLVFEKVCSDPLDQTVADWLKTGGIQRVVVGHKPTGDCPAVLSALYTGVEIVSADTSFSDTGADDNRGKAMSVVVIEGSSKTDNQLALKGTLRDDTAYESQFCRLHPGGVDTSVGDANLGRQLEHEQYWVKVATTNGTYWLSRGKGRQVEYKEVDKIAVLQSLKEAIQSSARTRLR